MKERTLLLIIFLAACAVGLVNVFLMPPFMNPDEIQHFMYAADTAYGPEELEQLDGRVLQLLKDHNWFHLIGIGPGWESIAEIKGIYFLHFFTRRKHTISRTYFHLVYGKLLALSGVKDPLTAFYFLRLVSFCLFSAIFLLSLFFYRRYFPGRWVFLGVGQLLIYQLGTILNAVNYDVILVLLGVLFFAASYVFLISGRKLLLVALLCLAALASLIKTAGLLFFLYLFLLPWFKYRPDRSLWKRLGLALILFLVVFSWFNYFFPSRFFNLYSAVFSKLRSMPGAFSAAGEGGIGAGFFSSIFDSFYFYTGWMGFKLGDVWYFLLKLVFFLSLGGVFIGVWKKKTGPVPEHSREEQPFERKWVMYCFMVFLLQLAAVGLYYGSSLMAQGRYLYPVIIPIVTLVYFGLGYLEETFRLRRRYLLTGFVLFQVIFYFFALLRVISVFYLEVASPHAGL